MTVTVPVEVPITLVTARLPAYPEALVSMMFCVPLTAPETVSELLELLVQVDAAVSAKARFALPTVTG